MSNSTQIPDHLAESVQALLASMQEKLPAPPTVGQEEEDLRDLSLDDPLLVVDSEPCAELDLPSEFVEALGYATQCRRMTRQRNVKAEEVESTLESCKKQIELINRLTEEINSRVPPDSPVAQ